MKGFYDYLSYGNGQITDGAARWRGWSFSGEAEPFPARVRGSPSCFQSLPADPDWPRRSNQELALMWMWDGPLRPCLKLQCICCLCNGLGAHGAARTNEQFIIHSCPPGPGDCRLKTWGQLLIGQTLIGRSGKIRGALELGSYQWLHLRGYRAQTAPPPFGGWSATFYLLFFFPAWKR